MLPCLYWLISLNTLMQACKWKTKSPMQHTFPAVLVPCGLSVEVHVEDRACNRSELKTGWNKNSMKRLRGLTGMWLDWHWCGVGDFLTRTCLQGWHCSQRDNNVAFLHRQHRPALILSECLSSSGKTRDPCQSASLVLPTVMPVALIYKPDTTTLPKK